MDDVIKYAIKMMSLVLVAVGVFTLLRLNDRVKQEDSCSVCVQLIPVVEGLVESQKIVYANVQGMLEIVGPHVLDTKIHNYESK